MNFNKRPKLADRHGGINYTSVADRKQPTGIRDGSISGFWNRNDIDIFHL